MIRTKRRWGCGSPPRSTGWDRASPMAPWPAARTSWSPNGFWTGAASCTWCCPSMCRVSRRPRCCRAARRGSRVSAAAWRGRRRSPWRPARNMSATTGSSPMGRCWPWAWPSCAPVRSRRKPCRSRSGTACRRAASPARRSMWRPGAAWTFRPASSIRVRSTGRWSGPCTRLTQTPPRAWFGRLSFRTTAATPNWPRRPFRLSLTRSWGG